MDGYVATSYSADSTQGLLKKRPPTNKHLFIKHITSIKVFKLLPHIWLFQAVKNNNLRTLWLHWPGGCHGLVPQVWLASCWWRINNNKRWDYRKRWMCLEICKIYKNTMLKINIWVNNCVYIANLVHTTLRTVLHRWHILSKKVYAISQPREILKANKW